MTSTMLLIKRFISLVRWLLVSLLTQPLAFSLGEIGSKYPTSAGAYYWCYRLAPARSRLLLSWINGWLNMVGVWTISLSVTFVSVFPSTNHRYKFMLLPGNCTARRCRCGYFPSRLGDNSMANMYVESQHIHIPWIGFLMTEYD